jgi:pimeloyl-ACP methyl ester carboxylesterase
MLLHSHQRISISSGAYVFEGYTCGPPAGELALFLHGFPDFADSWLSIMESVAKSGYHAVALNQRGYSQGARPSRVEDYSVEHLTKDVTNFADYLGARQFHLVGHDWGGLLAWQIGADSPDRVATLNVLSTPHPAALLDAIQTNTDQANRSRYIEFFRTGGSAAEAYFGSEDWKALYHVYQNKLPRDIQTEYVNRFAAPGALTGALNWYRALDLDKRIAPVLVPTQFFWGSDDSFVGQEAATNTAHYVTARYRFEVLPDRSHWLHYEEPSRIADALLQHFAVYPAAQDRHR